jgi:hypothetical protein
VKPASGAALRLARRLQITASMSARAINVDETRADRLRARAWHAAGIDAATAARLAREHRRLRPSRVGGTPQRAADVLDLDERARLMRGIAALYGRWHAAAPERLLWAGFAAIAVNDGVRPTTELTIAAATLARRAAWLSDALAARVAGLGRIAEDGIKCAFETNYAIFADLGWVHFAYLEGGLGSLAALRRAGELDAALYDAFAAIDSGARLGGDAGHAGVVDGNLALFRREQDASVTPVFARYATALSYASRIGLIAVPNRKLADRARALGRSPAWIRSSSYGPFAARWGWLRHHAWEPLVALHRERTLDGEVARAVRGGSEGARLARVAVKLGRRWLAQR